MKKGARILLQVAIVLISVLLLAEVFLRVTGKYMVYSEINGGEYYSEYGTIKPNWFHTRSPNDTFIPPGPDFHYQYITNKLGFRDKNYSETKPDSIIRILVTGDSYAEGVGAPYDSTWPRLLEKYLRAQNLNVEVMDAGVAGSDILYDYMFYREKLRSFHPDLVIASFNTSDYNDYFIRGGMERFHADSTTHFTQPPSYEKYYKRSRFLRALFHKIGGMRINGLFVSDKQFEAKSPQISAVFANVLDNYRTETEKNKAKFVAMLVTIPGELMSPENVIYGMNIHNIHLLDSLLRSRNVPCIDLYSPLKNQFGKEPPQMFTYAHDFHFNPTGYAFIAGQVSDSIAETLDKMHMP